MEPEELLEATSDYSITPATIDSRMSFPNTSGISDFYVDKYQFSKAGAVKSQVLRFGINSTKHLLSNLGLQKDEDDAKEESIVSAQSMRTSQRSKIDQAIKHTPLEQSLVNQAIDYLLKTGEY